MKRDLFIKIITGVIALIALFALVYGISSIDILKFKSNSHEIIRGGKSGTVKVNTFEDRVTESDLIKLFTEVNIFIDKQGYERKFFKDVDELDYKSCVVECKKGDHLVFLSIYEANDNCGIICGTGRREQSIKIQRQLASSVDDSIDWLIVGTRYGRNGKK